MNRYVFALVAVSLVGCGGGVPSDQPNLAPVKGVVTLDGEPVADANVIFSPKEGGGSSTATTDAQGNYELRYKRDMMGAEIGIHIVRVTTFAAAEINDEGKPEGGRKEEIPAKYNRDSAFEQTVESGENTLNLELTN